ncbi:MAG TPA: CAP domain-containing protein [Dehalococcoidia bacterium]|nr:CAP domain-containing protein [Dehalococcoidia bacterium]
MKALVTACAAATVGAIFGLSAITGSVDAASAPTDHSGSQSELGPAAVWNSKEKQVLNLHNQERARHGLAPLSKTTALGRAAGKRCTEITSRFSHTRPNGKSWSTVLAEFGISYSVAGENIAYGYSSPSSVHSAWMKSSGHRANILRSSFRKAGVGHCMKGSTNYWVVLFTN